MPCGYTHTAIRSEPLPSFFINVHSEFVIVNIEYIAEIFTNGKS